MTETKKEKIQKVREYIFYGVIINHPEPFIISRNNNKLRNLRMSYPIFVRELNQMVIDKLINLAPGKYYNASVNKKGRSRSIGCHLTMGPLFNKKKILIETSWSKNCNWWFPNVKDKINSKAGGIKLKILMYNDFIGRLNQMNRKHEFSIGQSALNVELVRLRSSGDDLRIYSKHGFQKIPKKLRQDIKIDNTEIIEIDITACHLSIMKKLLTDKGAPPKVTHFEVEDYRFSREKLKKAFYICLNSKNPTLAKRTIKKKLKIIGPKFDEFYQFLLSYFCEYTGFFYQPGLWKKLQIEEAIICDKVLKSCLTKDIPIIPIYDSFLVKKKDKDVVTQVLEEMNLDYETY